MAEQLKDVIKQEYIKSAKDPAYFLKKYCVIQHPIHGKFHLIYITFKKKHLKSCKKYD